MVLFIKITIMVMDPWRPLNDKTDGDFATTAAVTLAASFPQLHERKALDSTQYLSIIGEYAMQLLGCVWHSVTVKSIDRANARSTSA